MLLVLDNCEHVLGAVVPLVERLSRHCPRSTMLTTGRAPLGLSGEFVHVLAPLRRAGGRRRWPRGSVGRCRAVVRRPGRRGPTGIPARRPQSGRGGGDLPEARRPAAGHRAGGGQDAFDRGRSAGRRLDQRFALLAGQRASLDPRHHSLHRLVEWSYELLDPVDQEAFSRPGRRSSGSFDLEAAEVVCRPAGRRPPGARHECVIDLVDKSMVQVIDPDEPRYRLLETLREFGQERLRENARAGAGRGAASTVVRRPGRTRRPSGSTAPTRARWIARIDRDLDNLRAAHAGAVAAGDLAIAARLVAALCEYSFRRVRYEIAGWAEATMQMEGFERSPWAPTVLGIVAYGRWVRGDLGCRHSDSPIACSPSASAGEAVRADWQSGSSATPSSTAVRRRRRLRWMDRYGRGCRSETARRRR